MVSASPIASLLPAPGAVICLCSSARTTPSSPGAFPAAGVRDNRRGRLWRSPLRWQCCPAAAQCQMFRRTRAGVCVEDLGEGPPPLAAVAPVRRRGSALAGGAGGEREFHHPRPVVHAGFARSLAAAWVNHSAAPTFTSVSARSPPGLLIGRR